MADEDKYLGKLLGSLEYVMLLLVLICVIWLLVRDLKISVDVSKQGFYTAGAGLRFYGEQSQPNAPRYNQFSGNVERMGANEPPVFWNAGSYDVVSGSQQSSVLVPESNDQAPMPGQEGLVNRSRAAYLDGLQMKGVTGPQGVNLDNALVGM